jgi:ribosomal protein S10
MFELKTTTECELTQFTGRTQKSGRDDVPAVSLRLKIKSAKNTLLDMFSPTIRETIYAPVEGQEQLPGVEIVTPVLRCPDMKT